MWENWISSWRYCNRKNRKSSSIVSSVIYIMYVSRYYGGSNTVGYHNLVTIRSINGLILVSLFLIQSLHISHLNKGIYIPFRNVIWSISISQNRFKLLYHWNLFGIQKCTKIKITIQMGVLIHYSSEICEATGLWKG